MEIKRHTERGAKFRRQTHVYSGRTFNRLNDYAFIKHKIMEKAKKYFNNIVEKIESDLETLNKSIIELKTSQDTRELTEKEKQDLHFKRCFSIYLNQLIFSEEFEKVQKYFEKDIPQEKDIIFNFFMWFRENGEKHMTTKTGISIEKMIQIYLPEKEKQNEHKDKNN